MLVYPLNIKEDISILYSLLKQEEYSFWLDSSLISHDLGRYSFIGCEPKLVFRSKGDLIEWQEKGNIVKTAGNPLAFIDSVLKYFSKPDDSLKRYPFPFAGGLVGYLSYDLKNQIEELKTLTEDIMQVYDQYWGYYDTFMVQDNLTSQKWIVGQEGKKINILAKKLTAKMKANTLDNNVYVGELQSNYKKDEYIEAINKAKEYIRQGHIYQVNLSQCFNFTIEGDNLEFYKVLRNVSPSSFGAYIHFPEYDLLSISPERFIQIKNNIIETRPIKGTRPRGQTPKEDEYNKTELAQSLKDKAELLMIVDLERNDLGRISEVGSVKVPELFRISAYATVFHLDATVTGKLLPNITYEDILRATFPGGSITGAPKIRAMEIIEELEPTARGVYTGSLGYIDLRGNCDLNIAIRTATIINNQGYYQAGGGLTIDSDPYLEYQETWDKTKALLIAREEINKK